MLPLHTSVSNTGQCNGCARPRRHTSRSQRNREELNDPDFVNLSSPPGIPSDREGGKLFLTGFLNAFPDSRFTIDEMIAEGDRVATKKTFTGTHTADLGDIPATGKRVTLQYVDIMRLRNGRIVEHWHTMDQLSFLQQLGLMPA